MHAAAAWGEKGTIMALSRRDFLKVGGLGCIVMGAGAMAGCAPKSESEGEGAAEGDNLANYKPVDFKKNVDVLIIGTGYAGAAAAMEPALAGKTIILADKKSAPGGDSLGSCSFMFASGTKLQLDAGIPMTIDQYWDASKDKLTAQDDHEWFGEWVKGLTYANTEFVDCAMQNFGAEFLEPCTEEELPRLFSSVILPKEGIGYGGKYILTPILNKLQEMGAELMLDSRATALILNADGAVIGCRFEDAQTGKITDIQASSVVLATGGFADNGEMVFENIPDWANYAQLVHGCTGDGHKLGVAAGAALHGMDSSYKHCNLMGDIPNCTTWGYWTPIVLVLPNGKRFIKEDQSHDAALACVEAGYREWWSIFDHKAFEARAIASSVNSNIEVHSDVYVTADTVEELAEKMDVPVDNLVATFKRHDELMASGEDTDFGKQTWLQPLEPPFHALKLNVCRYKTSGGFLCGPNNEVLDTNDEEIPGLYACGACALMSKASASQCFATGYYTGQTIAAK